MSWEQYARAIVRLHLPDGPVQIEPAEPGKAQGRFPEGAGSKPISVVTAHNPLGETKPDSANRRLHGDLVRRLRAQGVTFFPAAGGDSEWLHVEESVAILGIDVERAREVGWEFGQDAIFVWTPDAWEVVSCHDDRVVRMGWSTTHLAAELVKVDAAYRALRLDSPYVSAVAAHTALEQALVGADEQTARRLDDHYLLVTSQYARERERMRRLEEERTRRVERQEGERRAAQGAAEEARPRLGTASAGAASPAGRPCASAASS